jgi:hypothetical protein
MDYVFTGFKQANAVRQFAFDCISDDRLHTPMTVRADLTLARKYNILPQELPLLCRRLLQNAGTVTVPGSMTLTEADMSAFRRAADEVVAARKPNKRPPPSARVGLAWR